MRRERMNTAGQEPEKDVLPRCPMHVCVDADPDCIVRLGNESRFVVDPMFKPGLALGVEPAEGVEDCCGDEVVPGGHAEVAVEEEEDDEDQGHEEVGCFEEFVVAVSDLC